MKIFKKQLTTEVIRGNYEEIRIFKTDGFSRDLEKLILKGLPVCCLHIIAFSLTLSVYDDSLYQY